MLSYTDGGDPAIVQYNQDSNCHHENIPIYFLPLKPHFYKMKLGFTGVYIIFLISAQKTYIVGIR